MNIADYFSVKIGESVGEKLVVQELRLAEENGVLQGHVALCTEEGCTLLCNPNWVECLPTAEEFNAEFKYPSGKVQGSDVTILRRFLSLCHGGVSKYYALRAYHKDGGFGLFEKIFEEEIDTILKMHYERSDIAMIRIHVNTVKRDIDRVLEYLK